MNAFTSLDYTTYPFATTNRKDFYNLMSVYLDATLHPLLKESDFLQEGWRIGPQNPLKSTDGNSNDQKKDLVFKGVVYNEMKGQMSDANYIYMVKFLEQIFPDIKNSAGDPKAMTDLTYAQLKNFHMKHYHPSNAKIFSYGDMPLADHLFQISQRLDQFGRIEPDWTIKMPINVQNGPLNIVVKGPADPLLSQSMQFRTSISWFAGDTADVVESFALGLLSSLLLDGYGSPLYRNLIETGLGADWNILNGYQNSAKIGLFVVGLNGVKETDVSKVRETIQSTLLDVHSKGFEESKVEGLLNQIELGLKHKTSYFGMGLMQRLQAGWFNGVDLFDMLAWNDTVDVFKQNMAKGRYLEGLIEKYLLTDRHMIFTMEPLETYTEDAAKEESIRLDQKIRQISKKAGGIAEAVKDLNRQEKKLLQTQSAAQNQDLSCLPSVHVQDIPRRQEIKALRDTKIGETKIQWREASTNGLTYFRAMQTWEGLPSQLRVLVPLFTDTIMRLDTRKRTVEEIEDIIKLKTGGISASYSASTSPLNIHDSNEGLLISGFALDKNVHSMYDLIHEILLDIDFNGPEVQKKVWELLQANTSGAVDAIASSGHSYARRYAEASLTPQGMLNEQTHGLTQVQHIALLASHSASSELDDIISKLKLIQQYAISNGPSLRVAITCEPESVSANEAALQTFLSKLPSATISHNFKSSTSSSSFNPKTFFTLPYQVYYAALALSTVPYVHSASAPLQILSQLLTHKHLLHEVREKGGAYGCGASARSLGGLFGFYSYRDPNPINTINIMQDAGRWACDKEWSDQDIEEAKLSVFQGIDAPQSVNDEGMIRFLSGIDQEMEQRRREQLLDVRKADIRQVAHEYLVKKTSTAKLVVLGEEREWVQEHSDWDIKKLQMNGLSKPDGNEPQEEF